jgi:hypothetical protein
MKMMMNKKEIEHWVNMWKRLDPSPKRDMVIKIWTKILNKDE